MVTRITGEFTSDRGVTWKVDLDDADYVGAADSWNLDSNGFKLNYQAKTDDRFTGLIPSEVTFTAFITSAAQQTIIDDIRTADYGRFKLDIQKKLADGSYQRYWNGNILNDINAEQDASFPTKMKLTAIDGLSGLKGIPINVSVSSLAGATLYTFIATLKAILIETKTSAYWGTGTSADHANMYIHTLVDWQSSNMPTRAAGTDPLSRSALYVNAYRTVNQNGTVEYQDAWDVLNNICKVWGARLFLSNGSWYFIQVNTYANMVAGGQFFRTYNKSATLIDSGIATYIKTPASGQYKRLAGGNFDFLPVLREANASYDHLTSYNMLDEPIVLWNGWLNGDSAIGFGIKNTAASPRIIDLGAVTALTGSSIQVRHIWRAAYQGTKAAWDTLIGSFEFAGVNLYYRLKLVGASTTYYANSVDNEWSTSAIFQAIDMGAPSSIGYTSGFHNAVMEFQTNELPVDGDLFIEAFAQVYYDYPTFWGDDGATELASTEATVAPNIYIFAPPTTSDIAFLSMSDESQFVNYLVNDEFVTERVYRAKNAPSGTLVDANDSYQVGKLFLGSGPTPVSWGRIRTSADGVTYNNGMDDDWQSYGAGTTGDITEILVEEIIMGQNEGAEIYNGAIKMTDSTIDVEFFNFIRFDDLSFVPYEVSFNANQDIWEGQYFEIDLAASTSFIDEEQDISNDGWWTLGSDESFNW
jgi:hypothetical protein